VLALPCLFGLLLLGGTPEPAAPPTVEVWAGHQILRGSRHVPLHGEVPVQTESSFIAKVQRKGHHIEIRQRFCRVEPQPVKGVTIAMSPTCIARMPSSILSIDLAADGSATIAPWTVAWGQEDIDGDGNPGATFTVGGTFCSGDVYVASESHYTATRAQFEGQLLSGEVKVEQKQQILGAKGLCLRTMAGDSAESQRGTFAYRPVPAGTTCQSLASKPWPVKAQTPPPYKPTQ
jgi:hypothetical protein